MITVDSTYTTESEKRNSQSLFLVNQEYDANIARCTFGSEFQQGSGADTTTKDGSVICETNSQYSAIDEGFGGYTNTLDIYKAASSSEQSTYVIHRFKVFRKLYIDSFYFEQVSDTTTDEDEFIAVLVKIDDEIGNRTNPSLSFKYTVLRYLYGSRGHWSTSQFGHSFEGDHTGSVRAFVEYTFEIGDYAFILVPRISSWLDNGDVFNFYYYNKTDVVFSGSDNFSGFNVNNILHVSSGLGVGFTGLPELASMSYNLNNNPERAVSVGDGVYKNDSFKGKVGIMQLDVSAYIDSTYTSPYMRVNDSTGSATTPTTNGVFRCDYKKPLNTDITFTLYAADDSVGTGEVNLGAYVDGQAITTLKAYYKVVAEMSTLAWYETPEIVSIQCYFPKSYNFVKSDESFIVDSIPAFPLVKVLPQYETVIDVANGRASFNELKIKYHLDKVGQSRSQSLIESIVSSYYLTGREISVKFGYKNLDSDYFISYMTGKIIDSQYEDDAVYSVICKDPRLSTADPYLVDNEVDFLPYFAYEKPVDILLHLNSMSGIAQREIDATSFSDVDALLSGWTLYRAFDQPIDKVSDLIEEILVLIGAAHVTLENGKVYLKKLDDRDAASVATFTKYNSWPVGKANIDLTKRINRCSVRRGYWLEPSSFEDKNNVYWDNAINTQSIIDVGASELVRIDSKWIPKDVKVNGYYLSEIVGRRIVTLFGYGVWTLVRGADMKFMYLQIGDQVDCVTDQILYKGFYGEKSVRGVIIGKEVDERNEKIYFTIWLYDNISCDIAAEPSQYPTSIAFSSITTTGMTVGWTNPSTVPDGYTATMRATFAPAGVPLDRSGYVAADIINDSEVVYNGASTSVAVSSLTPNTKYFFKIFPYNDNGTSTSRNYATATPLSGSSWTQAQEPANAATSLTFGTATTEVDVSWTAATGSPATQYYIVVRRQGSAVSWTPTDGILYEIGDEPSAGQTIRYIGSSVNFTDQGLSATALTYYYAVYSFNGDSEDGTNYNYKTTGLTGSVVTSVAAPASNPASLDLIEVSGDIYAEWEAVDGVTGYIVLMKQATSFTETPVDNTTYTAGGTIGTATVAYVGASTSVTDATPYSPNTYTYKVFAYNGGAGSEKYCLISPPTKTLTMS